MTFQPGQRVFELGDNAWDEHIRQSRVSVEGKPAQQHVEVWEDVPSSAAGLETYAMPDNRKIFLVHGHADEPKQNVANFLRSGGLEVVILHEKANEGQTIIEKFEKHADVRFAVVLLTPDDTGTSVLRPEKTHRRARQNVILELGYFLAKLGRNKVCCLYVEGVELPSDYDGVLYVRYNQSEAWRSQLVKELVAAGIPVDPKNLEVAPKGTQRNSQAIKNLSENISVSKTDDPIAEKRWNRVRDEISKLPEYNREALRLLLEYPSLTDYTALQKLGQLGRQNSLASVLPGLQNATGLVRPVPGQPNPRQPEYDLNWEIPPELRAFVERYFREMQ